jgi:hypothetical protein
VVTLFRPALEVAHVLGAGRRTNARREFVFDDNGWSAHVARLDVIEVPGDHDSMVLEPNVRVLAAKLQKCLRALAPSARPLPPDSPCRETLTSARPPSSGASAPASCAPWSRSTEIPPRCCRASARSWPRPCPRASASSPPDERARALLLARLGFAPAALLPGPERRPAVAARRAGLDRARPAPVRGGRRAHAALRLAGLDVEPAEPLEEELWSTLFLPRELELCAPPRAPRADARRVCSSAPRSACTSASHRCTAPRLEFHDVEVLPVAESERFRARLRPALRGARCGDQPLHGFPPAERGLDPDRDGVGALARALRDAP